MQRKTITREIHGEFYRISLTITERDVTIQSVEAATDHSRNLLPVMDRSILRDLREEFIHKFVNQPL